ncbi:MAG TPA: UV DNA damage repair endonuclease UvsE [Armatimonadota bacterium]|nr:UV DNA damage repair endonuclease UvsE [Armatimonadota bacterium]
MRIGYPCICLGRETLRCQRTTVLRNATPERLRALIQENLDGLQAILRFNEERGFRLFRIGNAFIPFASHPVNDIPWWRDYGYRFRGIGRWVREQGHRLSFHASHFTILNSEQPAVAEAALRDVEYMARVLEAMELGPEHKIILHGGVNSPSFEQAEERLAVALDRVPAAHRRHLVLENDERFYDAERMVRLARRLGLPVVVDVLHHACNPGPWAHLSWRELLERVFTTWDTEDRPAKMHFSSQDPDKKTGAHGYWIDGGELERFLADTRGLDFDIMFECKGKDLAVEAVRPILASDPRCASAALAA